LKSIYFSEKHQVACGEDESFYPYSHEQTKGTFAPVKSRFSFQPRYFLFWLLFFVVARAAFLVYYAGRAAALPLRTLLGTFGYGLRLDASMAAYMCLLPFVFFILSSLAGPRFSLGRVVAGYSAVVGVVLAVLFTADLGLYAAWGFRLDGTLVQYLNSPGEMAASAGSAPLGWLLLALALLLASGAGLYKLLVGRLPALPLGFGRWRAALAGLLYLVLLLVPLRGGVQQIPINQSDVYFSRTPFANHAAVNAAWNFMDAVLRQREEQPLPPFMPDSTAERLVRELYPTLPDSTLTAPTSYLLNEPRPNVLFIILESFTAKLVGCVGGERGVTPNLDSLAHSGVTFDHIYAAGDRSQKGLVALLSGYPNQPTTSIIKYPRKTQHLPHLRRSLGAAGYSSAYYYGGELAFANMKSYLSTAGYERLVERSDFAARDQNSKWGAHDHVLLDRILADIPQQRQPFFLTAFTLSSHEPFEIPIKPKFAGTSERALFRNSVYYTDWALGRFLRAARQQPWWNHTLVVLCADHGHPQPRNSANESPAKFHIPLILAGGALRPEVRGRVITALGSQTDVATTLLRQLGLPTRDYHWGRDLLGPIKVPFAYYCYTDGFGVVSPLGTVTLDNVSRRETTRRPGRLPAQLRLGEAYEQRSMEDFARR
jgi:phosphoglycerol transferase MdoB-like AlkP superfamily enzyme